MIKLFTKDKSTAAIAYPLRASNLDHLWAQFQDLEYLTAGYMKIAQVSREGPGRARSRWLDSRGDPHGGGWPRRVGGLGERRHLAVRIRGD